MSTLRTKTIAATTAAFVILGGGAAYAYWTTTGSGSSTAIQNAPAAGTLTLSASFAPGIAPGDEELVTFTATNTGTTDLQLNGKVHAEVGTDVGGCLPSWFTILDAPTSTTVPAGTIDPMTVGTSTLVFKNLLTTNQDACKGAKVTLTLSTL